MTVAGASLDTMPPGTPPGGGAVRLARARAGVDGFVSRHFLWPGTLHLHRSALGWDILRAPANVLLSPVLVVTRLAAFLLRRIGLRRAAGWLAGRRILLRTSVARRVEALVLTDLLGADARPCAVQTGPDPDPAAGLVPAHLPPAVAAAVKARILRDIAEYAGARTAVAEMTTTLCVIAFGALAFRALTPGMISMAPDVADAMARSGAIAGFPLGERLGGLWYGVFAVDTPGWLIAGVVAGLVMLGSVLAAFAGTLADPVQGWLGVHRRRLHRLLDTIERDLGEGADRPFVAREHVFARMLDLGDAVLSLARAFRG